MTTNVYPQTWTQFTITISGLPAPTSGRIAFRYFVTNAGPSGSNSDYIGVDNVVYTPYVCPAFTMTAGGALTGGTAGSAYSQGLTQTGALGAPNFAITAGALPPGLTLAANGTISGTPTATGTFNFTVTVNDASGCSGAQAYSITVVCPSNPVTISTFPDLCSNEAPYTLVEGSPGGGTYSGTGVSGGQFDPAFGSQNITYDFTDPYGCAHANSAFITVNTAPVVTTDADFEVCEGDDVILTGSGADSYVWDNGVMDGVAFTPAVGTVTYTVTGTDGNGCENTAAVDVTVNALPTVNAGTDQSVCDGDEVTLSGSGADSYVWDNGVMDGVAFTPAVGTETYTVTGTDGNGCENTAAVEVTVNATPSVSLNPFTSPCINHAPIALSGGTPAGGVYSGPGVSNGEFDPAAAGVGTHTITYTYEDGNGCEGSATASIEVDPCVSIEAGNVETLSVFPNPASSELNIVFENVSGTDATVVLTTTDGKVVYQTSAKAMSLFNEKINVTDFANGIYFININPKLLL